ncbi:hypothetical protein Pla175_24900 [Pirellulimonas nuda]|uniref:Uncharacterized protein n=1 Tax=Pirellulimonas nuda TaxID=2528009 RepID=A0A518DC93_9BACT|nr:hypothetical protein Pla175_24900 [Pirellulimonas nuda]
MTPADGRRMRTSTRPSAMATELPNKSLHTNRRPPVRIRGRRFIGCRIRCQRPSPAAVNEQNRSAGENIDFESTMKTYWQSATRTQAILAVSVAFAGILSTSGCNSRSIQPRNVSADDRRIASETVKQLESKVASNDTLVRRHGRFASMEILSIRRLPPVDFMDYHQPAMLAMDCVCHFESFSTKMEVQVIDGAAFSILMQPSEEFATKENSPLSDCTLVQNGDELWFVRTGGDQMRVQSVVTCQVSHPDFEP